jgi:outer membrane lipoprotein-sorting protein
LDRQSEGRERTAVNILRRLPLSRLLLLCVLVIAIGVSATALAFALGGGPTPPPKPLAQAIHDALASGRGESIEGVSASIQFTDHLLEGANLANGDGGGGGGEITSSPLVTGASGRLWIAKDGHARLELQSEAGDTQILWDGHTLQMFDAADNTLYRYTPPAQEAHGDESPPADTQHHEIPSVAKIEEAIAHLSKHADVSAATPTDVAGQPAYTVRVSPNESGSLFGGVELSFDADNGAPLRTAVYSSAASAPVIELAATALSFGAVESSVFSFTPPAGAKIEEIKLGEGADHGTTGDDAGEKPTVTTHGHGPATIAVLEAKSKGDATGGASEALGPLPKVKIGGVSADELRTELGTILTFVRSGVRYVVAGAVSPAAVEEVARGL